VCYNKGTVRERKKDTSMKANRKNNKASKALTIINIFAVIALAWIAVSTIEVISNNLDPNPTYAVWNIYNLIG
jgi:adenylate kinase